MTTTTITTQTPIPKWQTGTPMPTTIPAISLEYVRVPVIALVGGQPVDPTTDTVSMAFLTTNTAQPTNGDWKTATWDTPPTTGGRYLAQCLIGPAGTTTLTPATWWVWIKITATPETVIHPCGYIVIN